MEQNTVHVVLCDVVRDVQLSLMCFFPRASETTCSFFIDQFLCSSVINETGNANPLTSDYIPSYSNTRITSQGEWRASLFTYIFWWAFPYRQLRQWVTKLVRLLNLMHKDICKQKLCSVDMFNFDCLNYPKIYVNLFY